MNLVPFPRMHYLVSSQTPLYSLADIKVPARRCVSTNHFSGQVQQLVSMSKESDELDDL